MFISLLKIARYQCGGQPEGGGKERQKVVKKRLLLSATGEKIRYLTRTLFQKLCVGAVRTLYFIRFGESYGIDSQTLLRTTLS